MTPREKVQTVDIDTPALDVLHLLGERGLNQVPVLEDGLMVGLISRREILDRVQVAGSLAAGRSAPEGPDDPPEPHRGEPG